MNNHNAYEMEDFRALHDFRYDAFLNNAHLQNGQNLIFHDDCCDVENVKQEQEVSNNLQLQTVL